MAGEDTRGTVAGTRGGVSGVVGIVVPSSLGIGQRLAGVPLNGIRFVVQLLLALVLLEVSPGQ